MPGASKPYSQEEFISFIQKKDKVAFGSLYNTYSPVIYGVICKLSQDAHLSEEILQKVFVKIWQNISNFEPSKQRLLAWMLIMTRSIADEVLQQNKDSKIQTPNNNVINNKEVLPLIYFKGYSLKRAAEALNISVEELKLKLKMELDLIRATAVK